jgi:hypothetical protein
MTFKFRFCLLLFVAFMLLCAYIPRALCAGGDGPAGGKGKEPADAENPYGDYTKPPSPPHAPPMKYEPKTQKHRAKCLARFGIGVDELLTTARINKEFRQLSKHYHPDRVGHTRENLEYFQETSSMRDDLIEEVELGMQYITDRAVYRNGQYHFQRAGAGAGGGGFTSARSQQHTADFWRQAAQNMQEAAGGSAAGAGGRNHNPHAWFQEYWDAFMGEATDAEKECCPN